MNAVYTCKYFNRKIPKNASFWDPMEMVNKRLIQPVVGEVLLRVRVGGEAKFVDGRPRRPPVRTKLCPHSKTGLDNFK
jgi:hypothetical protein